MLRRRSDQRRWECARILDASRSMRTDLYFDRVSQIKMPAWSRGRVALVGDAAFCVSLMAGQGSALSMAAAYVLAGELAKAGGRHHEAFASYEALLRPFIEASRRAPSVSPPPLRRGRGWTLSCESSHQGLRHSGLARFALSRDIADSLRLPDYVGRPRTDCLARRRLDRALRRALSTLCARLRIPEPSSNLALMRRLFLIRHAKAEPTVGRGRLRAQR